MLSPQLLAILRSSTGVWPVRETWLFPGRARASRSTCSVCTRPAARQPRRRGSAKRVTVHSLRHSFATDPRAARHPHHPGLLGHNSLSTTARYTQVATTTIAKTRSPIDRLALERAAGLSARKCAGLGGGGIFRRHGAAYRSAHDAHMGRVERRIMGRDRSLPHRSLGGHVEACEIAGMSRIAYNSCRNRHCPKCQGLARAEWLVTGKPTCCRRRTSMSCSPCRPRWRHMAFQNKAVIMPSCSRRRPRHCAPSPPIRGIWAPRSASSPCSTGHASSPTTRISLRRAGRRIVA